MEPTDAQLRQSLERYDDSLALRAAASKSSADLVALDSWYRQDLRALVSARTPPHLTVAELGKLMEWKLAVRLPSSSLHQRLILRPQHGKWRPRLLQLALSNPAPLVLSTTTTAYSLDPLPALKLLNTLKGVGPATASAILALFRPSTEPFMSDEAYEAMGLGKAEYTVKGWEKFREAMGERRESGGWESVEELEKAAWSWGVERKYGGKEEKVGKKSAGKRKVEQLVVEEAVGDETAKEELTGRGSKRAAKKAR